MYSAFRKSVRKSGRKSPARKSARKSPVRKSVRKSARKSPVRKSGRKSVRRSPSQVGGARKKVRGSRSSVARGGSAKTAGGLSLGNGLFRAKDGRIKSSKVSKLAKSRFAKNPKLQARAKAVKEGFAAVKKARKGNQKINSAAVMKNPADAAKNPSKYLK